jgi:hypothetical protein
MLCARKRGHPAFLPETLDGIGFLLLLLFLIVDLVVASNLMSMMSAGSRENPFRQRTERANAQQHAGSESDKGGTDQAGDRFRGGHLCSVTDAPPGL